ILHSWRVEYEPAGDLVLAPANVSVARDSLLPGEDYQLSAEVFYFGDQKLDSVEFSVAEKYPGGNSAHILSQRLSLAPNSSKKVDFQWQSATAGEHTLVLQVDPKDDIPEPMEFNNQVLQHVFVRKDETPSTLVIYFDGLSVATNAYVSSHPEIECRIFDDSPAAIRDTSNVSIFLDGQRLAYANPAYELLFKKIDNRDGTQQRADILLRIQLPAGEHSFEFRVTDAFGHISSQTINVQVSETLQIFEVMNYPNPFRQQTHFTFNLSRDATLGTIKIYTLSGRLIQTLEFSPHAGFNSIPWDGLDARGDLLANGVYLYKVAVQQENQQAGQIQKLVIAR
ncbi:MAG: T9SS C-terminal target domain-containing protein, partial [Calditrichaeota bacterium]